MGCSGDRENAEVFNEEKWDYVNLNDFKSESCLTPFSYFSLWVFLLISCAVYGVDTFTAVNLLAFSRWSGRVEPVIPFRISRWIFAICILISLALLIYRWFWAIRAIRSGSITQSYLDPLAVKVQAFRVFGKNGRGWKRFLVFAELTKSKKGAEYVALYTYFSFHSWLNTVFADGPRQVLNAITLYSVMKLDLLPGGADAKADSSASGATQFFDNVKILAEENNLRAVVLVGMLFTLVIWVLSVLKLASGVVLYLIFLFHHIPTEDGSLKAYCRRKITTRLTRIVRKKVDKALAKGLKLEDRAPTKPNFKAEDSKPTLPSVSMDKTPAVTTVPLSKIEPKRHSYTRAPREKAATLPNLEQEATLPNMNYDSKPPLDRTITQGSAYSESASLTGHAATMGYSPLDHQNAPPMPMNQSRYGTPAPSAYGNLTDSGPQSYRGQTPAGPYARSNTPVSAAANQYGRSNTADPYGQPKSESSVAANQYGRSNTAGPYGQVNPSAQAVDQYGRSNTVDPYGQAKVGPSVAANQYGRSNTTNPSGPSAAANQYGRSNTTDPFSQVDSSGPSAAANQYGRSNTADLYGQNDSLEASVAANQYGRSNTTNPSGPFAAANQYGRSNTADPFNQVNSSGPSAAANQYGRSNTADPFNQVNSSGPSAAATQYGRSNTADSYSQVNPSGPSAAANQYGRSNTADPYGQTKVGPAAAANDYGRSNTAGPTFGNDLHTSADYHHYDNEMDTYEEEDYEDLYDMYARPVSRQAPPSPIAAYNQDPYQAGSITPAASVVPAQDPYRPFVPVNNLVAPQDHPYQSYTPGSTATASQDPTYQTYTPASTGATSQSQDPTYRSYTPASTGTTSQSQDPTYRSYTPASPVTISQDPSYRSYTPGSTGSAPNDSYQSYTPSAIAHESPRPFTPANSAITRPPASIPPIRTMTPTTSRGTPTPRNGTPMTPDSSGTQVGYIAFNPSTSMSPQTPLSTRRPSVPEGYRPFTRANTTSPSAMNRNGPPAGYSFNRANTDRF